MSSPRMPEHLTALEVAAVLRMKPYAVAELCKTGKLRATKPGRAWLIEADSLREYLEAGRPTQVAS